MVNIQRIGKRNGLIFLNSMGNEALGYQVLHFFLIKDVSVSTQSELESLKSLSQHLLLVQIMNRCGTEN